MSGQARFCTKCGTELAGGGRFCTKCGAEATVAPPVETVAPPVSSEHIHGLIPNAVLKGGFLGIAGKPYILVLTDKRIIFAHVTKEMMKQAVTDARDEAKAGGKGFFGQWGAQLGAYSTIAQRLAETPPDQILTETPENFSLERGDIVSAKLKAGHTDDQGGSSPDRLIIKATDKRKYNLMLSAGMRQAKEALVAAALI